MKSLICIFIFSFLGSCSSGGDEPQTPGIPVEPGIENEVDFFLTKGDQSQKLQKQPDVLAFGNSNNNYPTIKVNISFNVEFNGKWFTTSMNPESAGTYVWE